jgi:hypothetical protein
MLLFYWALEGKASSLSHDDTPLVLTHEWRSAGHWAMSSAPLPD